MNGARKRPLRVISAANTTLLSLHWSRAVVIFRACHSDWAPEARAVLAPNSSPLGVSRSGETKEGVLCSSEAPPILPSTDYRL